MLSHAEVDRRFIGTHGLLAWSIDRAIAISQWRWPHAASQVAAHCALWSLTGFVIFWWQRWDEDAQLLIKQLPEA